MFFRILILILAVLLPFTSHALETTLPPDTYRLSVSFDITASKIIGESSVRVRKQEPAAFTLGTLDVQDVTLNHLKTDFTIEQGTLHVRPGEDGLLTIHFEGTFPDSGADPDRAVSNAPDRIHEHGIFLLDQWYPVPDRLMKYSLKTLLPEGFEAISESEILTKSKHEGMQIFFFDFPYPVEKISLTASARYDVFKDQFRDIELTAYVLKKNRMQGRNYLERAKKHLRSYEKHLIPFPYKRLSIVEQLSGATMSSPSCLLIGEDSQAFPEFMDASIARLILHQWFGNFLYTDPSQDDWTRGLVNDLVIALNEEEKTADWNDRKQALINYASMVTKKNEMPLRRDDKEVSPVDPAAASHKASMVFHHLRRTIGKASFFAGLKELLIEKKHQKIAWEEIQQVFEKHSDQDLHRFFSEWVDRKGLPDLSIQNAAAGWTGSGFEITFDLLQKGDAYTLDIPAVISFVEGGSRYVSIKTDQDKKSVSLEVEKEPFQVVLDPDYEIPRKLHPGEIPPVLERLLSDESFLIVLPQEKQKEIYSCLIETMKLRGAQERETSTLKTSEIKSSSLMVPGKDHPVARRLFGKTKYLEAGCLIHVRKNPWNPDKVVVMVQAESAEEMEQALPGLFHSGRYSRISFVKGRRTVSETDLSERGITMKLREKSVAAFDLSRLDRLSDVFEGIADKKIVYVGENHDQFAHHRVQLEVIKNIFNKNPKIAIGMEMFQRPFQQALDDYIAGVTDEPEFLKNSDYFNSWGFDYHLYKPIIDFAREKRISLVALNIPRKITRKVATEGIDALSEEERLQLPEEMDLSDNEYKKRLSSIFHQHSSPGKRDFDLFYQAQIVWDEIMAQSIDEFLKNNPDRQMIVLVGGGHLAYGSGIPKRAHRRNGLDYAIILNDVDIEKNIAHYVVFPEPIKTKTSPKLMVFLEEKEGNVTIKGFSKKSVAEKAGLKKGDRILRLDGSNIKSVGDIKLALHYKDREEPLTVEVFRKRRLLKDKKMIFQVNLSEKKTAEKNPH